MFSRKNRASPTLHPNMPFYREPCKISAVEFTKSLAELLNSRFQGLAEADTLTDSTELVSISPEYTAYLIKLLLKYVDASSYLFFHCHLSNGNLLIDITSSQPLSFSLKEKGALCTAAKEAGFYVSLGKRKILLQAELLENRTHTLSVYEKPLLDLVEIFDAIFSEN